MLLNSEQKLIQKRIRDPIEFFDRTRSGRRLTNTSVSRTRTVFPSGGNNKLSFMKAPKGNCILFLSVPQKTSTKWAINESTIRFWPPISKSKISGEWWEYPWFLFLSIDEKGFPCLPPSV